MTIRCWLSGFILAALLAPPAPAASGVWTNTAGGGLWSDTANWSAGLLATGADATGDFSTVDLTSVTNVVQLDSPRALGHLRFGDTDTGTAAGWTLGNNGAAANLLTLTGAVPSVTVDALGSTQAVTLGVALAGTQGLTKLGAGRLVLAGTNTFTGGLRVDAGTVDTGLAAGPGAGGVTVSFGATLNLTGGALAYNGLATSLGGGGTVNVTLGTGSVSTVLNGNYAAFTGAVNVGIGAAAAAGKVQMNGADAAAATIRVLTNAALYANLAGTHQASLVLYGGDTGESLGQLRLEANAVWAGPVTLAGNITGVGDGTVGGNTGNTGTISGVIGETGGPATLSKIGAGTIILAGTNTYTGGTAVQAGTLAVTAENSLPAGAALVANASTLRLQHPNAAALASVTLSNGATLALRSDADATFEAASLAFAGDGAYTFTAGPLTAGVTNRALALADGLAGRAATLNYTGTNGFALALAGVNANDVGNNALTVNATAGTLVLGGIFGTYAGATRSYVTFTGAGDVRIGPAGINKATGAFSLGAVFNQTGTVILDGPCTNASGSAHSQLNSGTVIFKNTTVSALQFVRFGGGASNPTLDNQQATNGTPITLPATACLLAGDIAFGSADTTGPLILGGGITISNTRSITVNATNHGLNLTGVINDDTNSYGLAKLGPGTLLLAGANTFEGGLAIRVGTLVQSNNASAAGLGPITLGDVAGASEARLVAAGGGFTSTNALIIPPGNTGRRTIAAVSPAAFAYSGAVTLGTNLALEAVSAAGGLQLSGIIDDGAATQALQVSAANVGRVTLSGANTFDGGVAVLAGTLVQNTSASALGQGMVTLGDAAGAQDAGLFASGTGFTATNPIAVVAGAGGLRTLGAHGGNAYVYAGPVTLGAPLALAATNVAGSLRLGGVIDDGAGVQALVVATNHVGLVILSTNNTFDGGVYLLAGSLGLANPGSPAATNATPVGSGTIYLGATSGVAGANLQLARNNNIIVDNPIRVRAGSAGTKSIEMPVGSVTLVCGSAITLDDPLTVNLSGAGASLTFTNAIADGAFGPRGITKTGAGPLTLGGSNTYSGPTLVSAGTLVIGNGRTKGALSPASVITNLGALILHRSNTVVQGVDFADGLAGAGTLYKGGHGLLQLNPGNPFTGNVVISGGVVRITAASALGAGNKTVSITAQLSNAYPRLELNGGAGDIVLPTNLVFNLSGANTGFGVLKNLSGNNSILGALNLTSGNGSSLAASDGGTLTLAGRIATLEGQTTRTLVLGGSSTDSNTVSGIVADSPSGTNTSVTKQDAGTWWLTAANTYNGTTTLNGGNLVVVGALSTGAVSVGTAAQLGGTGLILGRVTVNGTNAPGVGGLGTLSVGSCTQAATGQLRISLTGPSAHSALAVAGAAELGGTLAVVTNGYAPAVGNAYTVLTAGALSGTFAATNLPPLNDPLLQWVVAYSSTDVVIRVQGVGATIGLSGNLAFGNVNTGLTAALTLTITNLGPGGLSVTNISYPAGFSGTWTGVVEPGSASNVLVTFAPPAVGSFGGLIAVQSDALAGDGTIACSGTGTAIVTGYDVWMLGITNAAQRGFGDDGDGDGDANLWEYSQGTDPNDPASRSPLTIFRTNGNHYVRFSRATNAVDLVVHVEAADAFTNGVGWSSIASNAFGLGWDGDAATVESGTGAVRQVTAENNAPSAPRRGLRVRVERP